MVPVTVTNLVLVCYSAIVLQDYILVRLVTALPVLWRPQLLAYLSFGPVLLLLLPTRLCLVECII